MVCLELMVSLNLCLLLDMDSGSLDGLCRRPQDVKALLPLKHAVHNDRPPKDAVVHKRKGGILQPRILMDPAQMTQASTASVGIISARVPDMMWRLPASFQRPSHYSDHWG